MTRCPTSLVVKIVLALVAGSFVLPGQSRAQNTANSDTVSDLRVRVDQLEQQLVEMQVALGTIESLAKGRPAGGSDSYVAPAQGGADVAQMDIQIRALSGQLAALTRQVQILQNGDGQIVPNAAMLPQGTENSAVGAAALISDQLETGGFGSVTITNEPQPDPIGSIISSNPKPVIGAGTPKLASVGAVPPRQDYDKAYGYLLEQDYGAAEVAFREFVARHPNDNLAGNAQYWLGETHYVRGSYRAAANAFLKGYKVYRKNLKAPDSLLKLAMSLSRLGQKPAACTTFSELSTRFPSAPRHVLRRADTESRRAGCK